MSPWSETPGAGTDPSGVPRCPQWSVTPRAGIDPNEDQMSPGGTRVSLWDMTLGVPTGERLWGLALYPGGTQVSPWSETPGTGIDPNGVSRCP